MQAAQHFAAQWGARLASTLNEERMRATTQKLRTTLQAFPPMVTSHTPEECLSRMGAYVAELLGAELCWVMTVDRCSKPATLNPEP